MLITLHGPTLVVLAGPSGSGKSTWANGAFAPTEILSSDTARAWVSDDAADQGATPDAFAVVDQILGARLRRGRTTCLDSTALHPEHRQQALTQARRAGWDAVLVVFDLPVETCVVRDAQRAGRSVGADVVRRHHAALQRSVAGLTREGFRAVFHLRSEHDVASLRVERRPLPCDRRELTGPFDIVGDVHGCFDELRTLLADLGWCPVGEGPALCHPEGRTLVFVGDLVDRGPGIAEVLELALAMHANGTAILVQGNHEAKLLRVLGGKGAPPRPSVQRSVDQIRVRGPELAARFTSTFSALEPHVQLAGGHLVVAHGGLKESLQGRVTERARAFALYGDTTGETGPDGYPVRRDWAATYEGPAHVVYGHTPIDDPQWVRGTINIDTGCVYGGRLSAVRWPERTLHSVPALAAHWPRRGDGPPSNH